MWRPSLVTAKQPIDSNAQSPRQTLDFIVENTAVIPLDFCYRSAIELNSNSSKLS
jgi:hypothetical protein